MEITALMLSNHPSYHCWSCCVSASISIFPCHPVVDACKMWSECLPLLVLHGEISKYQKRCCKFWTGYACLDVSWQGGGAQWTKAPSCQLHSSHELLFFSLEDWLSKWNPWARCTNSQVVSCDTCIKHIP